MDKKRTKKQLIRLGAQNPELQPHIDRVLYTITANRHGVPKTASHEQTLRRLDIAVANIKNSLKRLEEVMPSEQRNKIRHQRDVASWISDATRQLEKLRLQTKEATEFARPNKASGSGTGMSLQERRQLFPNLIEEMKGMLNKYPEIELGNVTEHRDEGKAVLTYTHEGVEIPFQILINPDSDIELMSGSWKIVTFNLQHTELWLKARAILDRVRKEGRRKLL